MKHGIILLTALMFSLCISAQKTVKVTISTSAKVADALDKCTEAGKEAKYGSKDHTGGTGETGTVTLWKYFSGGYALNSSANGNGNVLQILIEAQAKEGKTVLTLRMPYLPNLAANYTKELKKYVEKLLLPNMTVGDYWEGIE